MVLQQPGEEGDGALVAVILGAVGERVLGIGPDHFSNLRRSGSRLGPDGFAQ